MSVELVGLAFDERLTNHMWVDMSVEQAYALVLEDQFRQKVDPRSLLYHKGADDLLTEIEAFLKQGAGEQGTMIDLLAARFKAGVEEFPSPSGELSFDFKLIRQFSSLAMVDDYVIAESCLKNILKKVGFVRNGAQWSLLNTRDYREMALALQEVRVRDLIEIGEVILRTTGVKVSLENLVQNYIEFLGYAANNGLTPFFYSSEADFRKWGNLTERKNARGLQIVSRSLKRRQKIQEKPKRSTEVAKVVDFESRLKRRREMDWLVGGLKDRDPLVRQKSAESLGRLKDPEAFSYLLHAVADDEPEVRQEIVRALGETGGSRAEEVLLNVMANDEVFSVQLTAAYVLLKLGCRELPSYLIDGIEKGVPHYSTLLMMHSEFGKSRTIHLRLTALAVSENPNVRAEVAYLLGRLPAQTSKEVLQRLVKDFEPDVKINALYSLWKLKDLSVRQHADRFAVDDLPRLAQAGTILQSWAKSARS